MSSKQRPNRDARISQAIAELQAQVLGRYPEATFEVFDGEDPAGTYLRAIVDVEDTLDVVDVVMDHLLELEVDQGLPLYFLAARPVERALAELRGSQPPTSRVAPLTLLMD